MEKCFIFLFAFLLSQGTALRCYNCDPSSEGNCRNVTRTAVEETCSENMACVTVEIVKKGVYFGEYYRGCRKRTELCQYIKAKLSHDLHLRQCVQCYNDFCNN